MALTPSLLSTLRQLTSGDDSIPSINAGKLAAEGLIEKTGSPSKGRGYSHCRITEAGKHALAAA